MTSLLIRGAVPYWSGPGTPDAATSGVATDVLVRAGRIAEIGSIAAAEGVEVLDAAGLILLPGFVDLHTHLRQPGREDAETIASGSAAAAAGGFTAILAMANTTPATDTAENAEYVFDEGRRVGLVDVQPIGAVTKSLAGQELAELGLMARSRARVRIFSDDGHCVQDARLMRRALDYLRPFGGVISQHAQDGDLAGPDACAHEGEVSGRLGLPGWPTPAESAIIARDAELARHTGSRVHVAHVSTAEGVEVVRWAKARGIALTAEVTPHHLALGTELLAGYDPVFKVNPPLRPAEDREAIAQALVEGIIDAVATDHAPHARHDKEHAFQAAAFGMLGLESAFGVVHDLLVMTGRLDWAGVADRMSVAPARIAGLGGHGRPIAVGEPANLVLVDPATRHTVDAAASASLSRNNPWHGRTFGASVHATILRGVVTARGGRVVSA
ncbi:MAG: dihydroorotase [Dermatophilaceae bacterium]